MTENEIKEYVTEIRHKADIFRKSGFATAGFVTHFDKSADIIEELLEYKAIGTVEELKALKEKNVAKKPILIGYRKDGELVYECGCCGATLKVADQPFCMICSCKVDWK